MADSCQSASAYQEANSLFVDEDYDRAFEQYSKAIDLYDKKGSSGSGLAEIYVKRAACNTKLQKYTVADAEAAISLDSTCLNAYLKKGVALFSLGEYESASVNFKKCLHGDKYATQAQRWLRKCAAELAEDESDDDDAVDTEVEGQKAEASTSKEVSPPQETAKDVNTAGESVKARHDWYQTSTHVFLEIFIKKITKEQCEIDVTEKSVNVSVKITEHQYYENSLSLYDDVVASDTFIEYLSTKIVIRLTKKSGKHWASLEKSSEEADVKTVEVLDTPTAPAAFSSKRWDDILKDEEEDKLEGDAALNKVFQDIYGRGSDEQRKAMIKSFTESGGTVLSTNWEDVGKKKVECTPPTGLQAKTWKEAELGD